VGGLANSRREPSGNEIVIIGAFLAGNKKARQRPRLSVWKRGGRARAADQGSAGKPDVRGVITMMPFPGPCSR
jgi:hypothetical protein